MSATITLDGMSGTIVSTTLQTTRLCDAAGLNCVLPADVVSGGFLSTRGYATTSQLSGAIDQFSGNYTAILSGFQAMILQLSGQLAALSGRVTTLSGVVSSLTGN